MHFHRNRQSKTVVKIKIEMKNARKASEIDRNDDENSAVIMTKEGETEDFVNNLGVRQGDGVSKTVIFLAMDAVMKKCNNIEGRIINKGIDRSG